MDLLTVVCAIMFQTENGPKTELFITNSHAECYEELYILNTPEFPAVLVETYDLQRAYNKYRLTFAFLCGEKGKHCVDIRKKYD